MDHLAWGSPIGLGVLMAGLGILFFGLGSAGHNAKDD